MSRINPKDPFQIGKTPDGKPIWFDPASIQETPTDKLIRADNISKTKREATIQKLAVAVLENAAAFVNETFINTAAAQGVNLLVKSADEGDPNLIAEWAIKAGYSFKQDGLTTVILVKDKAVRQMTANVDPRFALDVAKRVMRILKQGR